MTTHIQPHIILGTRRMYGRMTTWYSYAEPER